MTRPPALAALVAAAVLAVVATLAAVPALATNDNASQHAHITGHHDSTIKDDPTLFWGTWRPHLYFGLRTRAEDALLAGLMWFSTRDYNGLRDIRHTCEQHEELHYGYHVHDGREYALQHLNDTANNLRFTTEVIKRPGGQHGGDWVARIRGEPLDPTQPMSTSFLFYAGLDGNGKGHGLPTRDASGQHLLLNGESNELGEFSVFLCVDPKSAIPPPFSNPALGDQSWETPRFATFSLPKNNVWKIKDLISKALLMGAQERAQAAQAAGYPPPPPAHIFALRDQPRENELGTVAQLSFEGPFAFDVTFVSHSAHLGEEPRDVAHTYQKQADAWAQAGQAAFYDRFESTFQLRAKGFDSDHIAMAQYALSNMLGGMGFFSGDSRINPAPENEADKFDWLYYWDPEEEGEQLADDDKKRRDAMVRPGPTQTLFTATPSRPFFPRGFLWDEGFHQTLLQKWDQGLTMSVLQSWYALMDAEGWIAREQILGDETRAKVPVEFHVQSTHIANPPTLLLAVQHLADTANKSAAAVAVPDPIHPGMPVPLVGASAPAANASARLLAPFLADLLPRLVQHWEWFRSTQYGSATEYGRDLDNTEVYRWRGRTARHNFASGLDDYPRADPPNIGELHVDLQAWMAWQARVLEELLARYPAADKDGTLLKRVASARHAAEANLRALFWSADDGVFADLTPNAYEDASVHAPHRGYVALLPFALQLLDPHADKDAYTASLALVRELAAAGHGVRSLSPRDPAYGQGENYWRGAVWVNYNYLVLSALHKYGASDPAAREVYDHVRKDVIRMVMDGFRATGFLYENYDGESGKPRGSHPFTGWTSLVVLIMAELY
ncbi:hypothetical protein AMAG_16227 [Allomyces macrogynus ATCC 38327]|uniref:Mannosyl-oligosaccharide glucosidase n=1 Tax=Allomyces macrogynus (strain ATCC 38327) TaxID=578462 RepID=A0A0L0TA34_ALLM3|nr:hypothetical protein AMAG_16227 [Allomyces macrogynus ATCC 38327]|eukprot:KNE71673.1 hypothetical protein AMAG_16227 [Allomyces macrogynus ATCC 38327]